MIKILLALCLFLLPPAAAQAAALAAGHAAPSFILRDANGKPVSLAAYKGKVVLLNFWATWCAPCRVEMPWFEEFFKTYEAKGFVVLGVSLDDGGWKPVRPAIAKLGITYPIMLGSAAVSKSYSVGDLLPVSFLIDRHGKIQTAKEGFGKKEEFTSAIEKLLAEK